MREVIAGLKAQVAALEQQLEQLERLGQPVLPVRKIQRLGLQELRRLLRISELRLPRHLEIQSPVNRSRWGN